MFGEVDTHIAAGTLIKEFKMSALPSLYEQFVQLIKYLVILNSCAIESAFGFFASEGFKVLPNYWNLCSWTIIRKIGIKL